MLPTSPVPIPVPEPLALLDATLVFLIQVLIAQHPDLLAAIEEKRDMHHPAYPRRAAHHLLLAVREVHYALDTYRAILPDKPSFLRGLGADTDDFPF